MSLRLNGSSEPLSQDWEPGQKDVIFGVFLHNNAYRFGMLYGPVSRLINRLK